jgi:hypothetical protein
MFEYNYSDNNCYADKDGNGLIIKHIIINPENGEETIKKYYYEIGEMNPAELDLFTRQKIQEIHA